jgi:hypothetical protein
MGQLEEEGESLKSLIECYLELADKNQDQF